MEQETNNEATVDKELDEQRPNENGQLAISGHIKIFDPNSGEVIVDKRNAIHYENISEALEVALAHSDMVPDYTNSEIDELVCDYWNDLWSKYA